MPLYEYQCDCCSHRFEVIQKFSDPPVEVCQACGGPVKRLLSSPAIQFKGSGWYITDYARAGKSEGGKAATDKGDKAAAAAETSAKAEAPASATPPAASKSGD